MLNGASLSNGMSLYLHASTLKGSYDKDMAVQLRDRDITEDSNLSN